MINNTKGFTIIELLVAVVLAAVVTGAAMGLYIVQHKQLIVQDQVSDMQSNVRAAEAEIVKQVRMAGFKVPNNFTSLMNSNTNPDTLFVAYNCDITDIHLSDAMPNTSAELKACDSDLTPLHDNEWAYIYDLTLKTGEYFLMTNVQYSSGHIQHNTMRLSHQYPAGSLILKMNFYKYYIDQTIAAHPNLMVQYNGGTPAIYAENINGLNFQFKLSSGAIVDVPTIQDMIREVIIQVTARTDQVDQQFQSQYRARTLTSSVKVRNLGVN